MVWKDVEETHNPYSFPQTKPVETTEVGNTYGWKPLGKTPSKSQQKAEALCVQCKQRMVAQGTGFQGSQGSLCPLLATQGGHFLSLYHCMKEGVSRMWGSRILPCLHSGLPQSFG